MIDLSKIPDAKLFAESQSRIGKRGGRPRIPKECPRCHRIHNGKQAMRNCPCPKLRARKGAK